MRTIKAQGFLAEKLTVRFSEGIPAENKTFVNGSGIDCYELRNGFAFQAYGTSERLPEIDLHIR
jgi:hypothetical protein